jgi:hypothetical protein
VKYSFDDILKPLSSVLLIDQGLPEECIDSNVVKSPDPAVVQEKSGRPIQDINFAMPLSSSRPGERCRGYVRSICNDRGKVFQMPD